MSADVSSDHTRAAAVYEGTNIVSWGKQIVLPMMQAVANIRILDRQRRLYGKAQGRQNRIVKLAIDKYEDALNKIEGYINGAYPSVPQAAQYVPVDPCLELSRNIEDNIRAIPKSADWAQCVSRLHNQSDIARLVVLDPRWLVNIDMYSTTLGELLKGQVHVSDLMEVMTDAAEESLVTGRVGSRSSTAQKVTQRRLKAQAEGRQELQREAALMAQTMPIGRQAGIDQMMVKPENRMALALSQAQLVQSSLQNLYNRRAEKPPWRMAQLQIRLDRAINQMIQRISVANMQGRVVPNYAAMLQPAIHELTRQIQGDAFSTPSPDVRFNMP